MRSSSAARHLCHHPLSVTEPPLHFLFVRRVQHLRVKAPERDPIIGYQRLVKDLGSNQRGDGDSRKPLVSELLHIICAFGCSIPQQKHLDLTKEREGKNKTFPKSKQKTVAKRRASMWMFCFLSQTLCLCERKELKKKKKNWSSRHVVQWRPAHSSQSKFGDQRCGAVAAQRAKAHRRTTPCGRVLQHPAFSMGFAKTMLMIYSRTFTTNFFFLHVRIHWEVEVALIRGCFPSNTTESSCASGPVVCSRIRSGLKLN